MAFLVLFSRSASNTRTAEFYTLLEAEAITKFNLVHRAGIPTKTLQAIYRENRNTLNEVEVAVYNQDFELIYHDDIDIDIVKETDEMLKDISQNKRIVFEQDLYQVVGLRIDDGDEFFIVTAAAYDEYGYNKLYRQRNSMWLTFVALLLVLFISSRYIARKSLQPLRTMVDEAKSITAQNLYRRLPEGKGKDELEQLAITFNAMLERLESSFGSQQSFVSNMAHEVRTPLAGILGEIDLSLEKPRSPEEYEEVLKIIREDAKQLGRLTQSLLDLAKAGYDASSIELQEIRLDEVVLEALAEVQQVYPQSQINLVIEDNDQEEENLLVMGNAYLLKVAVANVLENACKYSEQEKILIQIKAQSEKISISIRDKGPGISEEEQEYLFEPFYRGSTDKPGTGIGLSLVSRIIEQHKGEIKIKSKMGKGTNFIIKLWRVFLVVLSLPMM